MKNRIHLRLEELNKDERKAYMMLTYIALTYRANLTTLSELFKIDPHELHEKLLDYNYSSDSHLRGLEFLFWGDKFNQEKSAEKIMAFYLAWIKLSKIEDKEARDNEKAKLLGIIKSIKGYNALMKLKSGETLTEEEMLEVLKYQLKYGLTYDMLNSIIGRDPSAYNQRLLRILSKYPNVKVRYDLLMEYNKDKGKQIALDAIRKNGGRKNG